MNEGKALFRSEELPVSGQRVTAITLDSSIVLFFGDDREHEIRIGGESDFKLKTPTATLPVRYSPYSRRDDTPRHVTELCSVVPREVTRAAAYVDGVLELELDNGMTLLVEPHPQYEAWVYAFGTSVLACPPGGDLRPKP